MYFRETNTYKIIPNNLNSRTFDPELQEDQVCTLLTLPTKHVLMFVFTLMMLLLLTITSNLSSSMALFKYFDIQMRCKLAIRMFHSGSRGSTESVQQKAKQSCNPDYHTFYQSVQTEQFQGEVSVYYVEANHKQILRRGGQVWELIGPFYSLQDFLYSPLYFSQKLYCFFTMNGQTNIVFLRNSCTV